MSEIVIKSVVKSYGAFTALHGIDLHVKDGEFVSLLGPSGCGKTTLLRSIAGLESISGGEISIGGEVMTNKSMSVPPEKRHLGMMFQSYALWPHMSVFDNVAFGVRMKKLKRDKVREKVLESLDLVGLSGLSHRYPSELSGGQMQRVALARSLAPEPKVLLFDEPLSNLDSKLRERMRYELREVQQRVGTTAIYVTHDQSEAMVMSDRVVLLNKGQIVQVGSARDLYERPKSRFAADFLGVANFMEGIIGKKTASGGHEVAIVSDLVLETDQVIEQQEGAAVTVSIRPEHIDVTDVPNSLTTHKGQIKRLVYLGNLVDVFVDVHGIEFRSLMIPRDAEALRENADAYLSVAPKNIRLISTDSSAAVPA